MLRYVLYIYLVIPSFLYSQDSDQIRFGTNLIGELEQATDINSYHFAGDGGDRIWLRVSDANSDIDASFRLIFESEILITAEGSGGDVEAFDFVLPDTGTYTVEIYDKNHNDAGAYGFSLHKLNNPEYARQIQCGNDVFDRISTQVGIQVYQFEVQAGDIAFAQMRATSSHFEASMYLFNEHGDLLKKSVRKANPFAIIDKVEVAEDQTYALFVYDANGNDTSSFGLTYQDINDPTCGTIPLQCRDHKEDKIEQLAETHAFQVDLAEDEGFVAKILSETVSMEATVMVFDPEGKSIFENSVSGKANDIVIPRVKTSGTYLIILNDDRANDTSSYYLTYNKLDISCARELPLCHEFEAGFEVKADINLYYFFMPEQRSPLEIKEIDAVIEPYSSLIFNHQFENKKDNVKLKLDLPEIETGNIVFLAMSDNGGNDLGRYKFKPGASFSTGNAPVALIKKGLEFTLPVEGSLSLTVKDLDDGSYDDCQIVDMFINPSSFDCSLLGENEVELTVIDNEGFASTARTIIKIKSDLELDMEACMKIPVEEYTDSKCIEVQGKAKGGSGKYDFHWSNGAKGEFIKVCKDELEEFSVKVTDSNGCSAKQEIWIPLGDRIECHPNGKKITICHLPPGNTDNAQELCVSTSSLKAHFGHGDYLGPCDGPCGGSEESEIVFRGSNTGINLVKLQGIVGHSGEVLQMHAEDLDLENGEVQLQLVNGLGQIIYRQKVNVQSDHLAVKMPDSDRASGLYYLFIRQTANGQQKQITLPIVIQQ
ncbi:MAG: hypothetical protein KDC80_03240 [Saprospiraceae bacterium]|nr:hypothetical protein [Saprospiraceae bacterium]